MGNKVITEQMVETTDVKQTKKTKKELNAINKIVENIIQNVKTLDDVRKSSSIFFVRKDSSIEELPLSFSMIKSEMGEVMIDSFIDKAKSEQNEVEVIVKTFFAKGMMREESDKDVAKEKAFKALRDSARGIEPDPGAEDFLSNFMVAEIYNKKCFSLNAYEFITSDEDKKTNTTYVCINPNKTIEKNMLYKDNSYVRNYFE